MDELTSYSPAYTNPAPERRSTERLEISGDLRGEIMVLQPLVIKEIGRDGALAESAFPLQLNSLHELRLTLGDHSIVVTGRVAHSRISWVDHGTVCYRLGLEFMNTPERTKAVIAAFVEGLKNGQLPNA